jgi:hypothetical protein
MAIKAAAAVSIGPKIARQSTFMRLFSFVTRLTFRDLPDGCAAASLFTASLKRRLPACRRFPGFFDQNHIEIGSLGE